MAHTRVLFEFLEARFGRLADLVEPIATQRVLTSSQRLEAAHLQSLLQHEAAVVHVKGFLEPGLASRLGDKLKQRDAADAAAGGATSWKVANGRGMESSDVRAVGGTPFAVASHAASQSGGGDSLALERYFEEVPREEQWMADAMAECSPSNSNSSSHSDSSSVSSGNSSWSESPWEMLRSALSSCWPAGAEVLKDSTTGQKFLPGLGRVMRGPTRWRDGFCHVDDLAPLDPSRGLFSANLYLEMPPVGGELLVWPLGFKTGWKGRWDFYRHASTLAKLTTPNEEDQASLRKALAAALKEANTNEAAAASSVEDEAGHAAEASGDQAGDAVSTPRVGPLRLRPQPGDLVILCTQRPHAVQGFPLGCRVSLQTFITHSQGEALTIDN